MTYSEKLEHYSREAVPHVGAILELDEWGGQTSELFVCSDWDKAAWRMTSSIQGLYPAVNIDLTGRKVFVYSSNWMRIRIRVTFVGDCEPDTTTYGWLYFDPTRDLTNDLNPDRVPAGVREGERLNAEAIEAWDAAAKAKAQALQLIGLRRDLVARRAELSEGDMKNVIHGLTVSIITVDKETSDLWEKCRVKEIEARDLTKQARWA